jgi:ribosomal protein L11 methyltransferase
MTQIWIYQIPLPEGLQMEQFTDLFNWLDIEGLEEEEFQIRVYVNSDNSYEFEEHLSNVTSNYGITFTKEPMEEKNWNEDWERSFQPVKIGHIAGIRASFHPPFEGVQHDIIINPKMSFGTGHHATTRQVMQIMSKLPIEGSKVLDCGSGTGILAILAAKMGAAPVVAVDNDRWCFENHLENNELNEVDTAVLLGTLEDVQEDHFDLVLANIQRNFLLEFMADLAAKIAPQGYIIISGFLPSDNKDILDCALECHLHALYASESENWSCILLQKQR